MVARIVSLEHGEAWAGDIQRKLNEIAGKLNKSARLRVGFLEGATYPDGTPVAMIAAIHEYGAPSRNIPSRPFFRQMIRKNAKDWPDTLAKLLVANDLRTDIALDQMGFKIKDQLQQEIFDFVGVPLKPATIVRKGFDKQLVDTGHMANSVDFEVETKE